MNIVDTLKNFDTYLKSKALSFEGIAIGGAALNLIGVVSRFTRDCDILSPTISDEIQKAAKEFAKEQTSKGIKLDEKWFNNGPASLIKHLTKGWDQRTEIAYDGKALKLHTLAREDLIKTKLFAFCDRGTDRDDCLKLKITREELSSSLEWVSLQDANIDWPAHVKEEFQSLAKELGYEL